MTREYFTFETFDNPGDAIAREKNKGWLASEKD